MWPTVEAVKVLQARVVMGLYGGTGSGSAESAPVRGQIDQPATISCVTTVLAAAKCPPWTWATQETTISSRAFAPSANNKSGGLVQLPNADIAIVEETKLRDYCLNPQHEEGRHKARVFRSALGLSQGDAAWLAAQIQLGILNAIAVPQSDLPYGKRFAVDLLLQRGDRSAAVRTAWIIRDGEAAPRLVSCFVR